MIKIVERPEQPNTVVDRIALGHNGPNVGVRSRVAPGNVAGKKDVRKVPDMRQLSLPIWVGTTDKDISKFNGGVSLSKSTFRSKTTGITPWLTGAPLHPPSASAKGTKTYVASITRIHVRIVTKNLGYLAACQVC